MSGRDGSFAELMARLRAGDDAAEILVFRRSVRRLIALASRQFEARMRDRADAENVVLSAYRSFFHRHARGEFDLAGWDELWSLLAVITLHKCTQRRKYLRAARRDAGRNVRLPERERAPTPAEAAILTETIGRLFQLMAPDDRPIVEQILLGCTAEEIAERLDCSERTVRRARQRAKHQLQHLLGERGAEAGTP